MNEPTKPTKTNNDLAEDRTELAKYRSRAAADRTLMAWIRTSLSLISFGFGIPTIVKAIEETQVGQKINPVSFSVIIGLSFIGIGMFSLGLALKEHRQILKLIQSDRYIYDSSKTTETIAIALFGIGIISFLGVILKALNF
jgi:putative membrane protein